MKPANGTFQKGEFLLQSVEKNLMCVNTTEIMLLIYFSCNK